MVLAIALVLGAGVWPVAGALAQNLAFDPAESVPSEPEFTVDLTIDCGGEQVKGVEVKVAYDPFLVRLDAITPGAWYTASGHQYYLYDYTGNDPAGSLHIASAVLDGSLTGSGVLAVCHFTILDFGISPLVFQDVDVRSPVNVDLGFTHTVGDRIILDPVVPVQARAFGAIKAIYR